MEEIIVFPVENNPNGEYALQEVGGTIAGTFIGLMFLGLLISGKPKIRKTRQIQEKKWAKQRGNDPKLNTREWQQHRKRLNKFGESKYQDTHFYIGPKDGVYYIPTEEVKFIAEERLLLAPSQ